MSAVKKKSPALSAAAAQKYRLVKIKPGLYHVPGFGEVNLCTISLAKAEQLAASGSFPFLVEKKTRSPKTKP